MSRRIALVAAAFAVAALAVQAATAAPKKPIHHKKKHAVHKKHATHKKHAKHAKRLRTPLLLGVNDEALTLYGNPADAFEKLAALHVQVLRVNLYWGGTRWAVANKKPKDATDPGDQAYNWDLYDRLARYAATYHIQLMFSILFSPRWANGHKARNVAPKSMRALQDFATAAATRYNGFFVPPAWQQQPTLEQPDEPLPAVNLWTAWNEPNNPVFLSPQYKRVHGKWKLWSPREYAKICDAIYRGVHKVSIAAGAVTLLGPRVAQKEQVACGVTDPRGNDHPGKRASVDPLSFLIAAKKAHMGPFDAYAHNPYASSGKESPKYVPRGKKRRRVQLGNINVLIKKLTAYYGHKPIWITEYGYQTDPPNKTLYGTSWKNQAKWLRQSVLMARKNPRIAIFLWYLVQDGPSKKNNWQSGLETITGKKKPAWKTFAALARR